MEYIYMCHNVTKLTTLNAKFYLVKSEKEDKKVENIPFLLL